MEIYPLNGPHRLLGSPPVLAVVGDSLFRTSLTLQTAFQCISWDGAASVTSTSGFAHALTPHIFAAENLPIAARARSANAAFTSGNRPRSRISRNIGEDARNSAAARGRWPCRR